MSDDDDRDPKIYSRMFVLPEARELLVEKCDGLVDIEIRPKQATERKMSGMTLREEDLDTLIEALEAARDAEVRP